MVKLLALLLIALPWGGCGSSSSSQASAHTETVAQKKTAPSFHYDPQSVMRNCGRPDHLEDSVFIQQGGGITSRSLTYNKAHLRLTYISSGPGDSQWDFSSLVDTATNRALAAGDLQSVLESRLPCAVTANSTIARKSAQSRRGDQRSGDKSQGVGE